MLTYRGCVTDDVLKGGGGLHSDLEAFHDQFIRKRLMDDSLERLAVWFWGAVGGFLIGAGFSQDWTWLHWVGGAMIAFFFYWLAKNHR